MNKVDWSKAPLGAKRYNTDKHVYPWLLTSRGLVFFHDGDDWMKYADQRSGAEHWVGAIQRPKPAVPTDVDATITQRGERYGKFKDGSAIMQNLKNIMRETPNWEGLTPSQREALEMIQHKVGRILNDDPMYDDNWRDICGYSQLILDELNGAVR